MKILILFFLVQINRGPDLRPNPTTFKLQSDSLFVIVRNHKVTVLISTFSEFENVPSTVAATDELQSEPEGQPGATAEAPVRRRNKRKKVGGAGFSFIKLLRRGLQFDILSLSVNMLLLGHFSVPMKAGAARARM